MKKIRMEIEGLSCGHCVQAVETALKGVSGVEEAQVSLEAGQASVAAADGVALEALADAVVAAGYQVTGSEVS